MRQRVLIAGLLVVVAGLSILALVQRREIRKRNAELAVLKETVSRLEQELVSNAVKAPQEDLGLLYVSVDGKRVSPDTGVITEYGFRLDSFCNAVWPGAKLEILERSRTKGVYNDDAPVRFRVTVGCRCVEFDGVAYKSSANGELVAEYIAGEFGWIRARYRRGIFLRDRASIGTLFDLLGIPYEFRRDTLELSTR